MLSVKQGGIEYHFFFFESLVWLNLELNPGLLSHWWTLSDWCKVSQVSITAWSISLVLPHWRVVIQRNSFPVDNNIYIYIHTHQAGMSFCLDLIFAYNCHQNNSILLYVFTQPLLHELHVILGHFLNRVQMVWIQSFPSKLFIIPSFKSSVIFT